MTFQARLILVASTALIFGASVNTASAQGTNSDAREAWAARHIRQVCQPLAQRGLKSRASRCYGQVARAKADPNIDFGDVTASLPARAAEPQRPAPVSSADMNRCAGIACIQRFPTLGISY